MAPTNIYIIQYYLQIVYPNILTLTWINLAKQTIFRENQEHHNRKKILQRLLVPVCFVLFCVRTIMLFRVILFNIVIIIFMFHLVCCAVLLCTIYVILYCVVIYFMFCSVMLFYVGQCYLVLIYIITLNYSIDLIMKYNTI